MDYRIYDLLNDVEMDLDEYEEKELSSKEKQKIEQRLLQEVKKMKKQEAGKGKRSGKTGRKIAGIAAAACVAVSAMAIGSNPVAAKALLGSLYEKIIAGNEGEKDAEEMNEIYTKIGEESMTADSVAADSMEEAPVLETEDAGVNLRVCDIFCDGYKIYYTLELITDNKDLTSNEIDGIQTAKTASDGEWHSACKVGIDGEDDNCLLTFRRQEDGTYASVENYSLFATEKQRNYENGDVIPIEISIKSFMGEDYDNHDEEGEYVHTANVEGEWKLSFPVTVDTSDNVVTEINKEDNGVRVVNAVRTKATLNLIIEAPDFSKEPYNDPYNDPDIGIRDAAGNWMQMLGCYDGINGDGTHVYRITLLDNGEKDFYLDVTERTDENPEQIAGIAFQVE